MRAPSRGVSGLSLPWLPSVCPPARRQHRACHGNQAAPRVRLPNLENPGTGIPRTRSRPTPRRTPPAGISCASRANVMIDLGTRYLGLEFASPLVMSASPLSEELDNIRRAEDAGAGAVVLPSLFEEQL